MRIIRIMLLVVFGWSFMKGVELLVRPNSLDRLVFEGAGLAWLFWPLLVLILLTQLATIVYLVTPFPGGYALAQSAVVLGALETIFGSALALQHPSVLRAAMIASRTERGLRIDPQVLRMAEQPRMLVLPIIAAVLLASIWLVLLMTFDNARSAPKQAAGLIPR